MYAQLGEAREAAMSNVPESDAQWLPAALQGRLSVDELVTDPLWPALSSGARRMLLVKATAGRATPAGDPARRNGDALGTPGGVPASSGDGKDVPHSEALVPAGRCGVPRRRRRTS